MHCAICDKEDDTVNHINTDCQDCRLEIKEIISGYYNDDPEDDLGPLEVEYKEELYVS